MHYDVDAANGTGDVGEPKRLFRCIDVTSSASSNLADAGIKIIPKQKYSI
jgi:hypothetical protein